MDGTLTDLGANTWAVAYWKHLEQPECFFDASTLFTYGGIICDSSIEVRRLAFHGYAPKDFRNQEMKILRYDNIVVNEKKSQNIFQEWLDEEDNYSVVKIIHGDRPSGGAWAIPFVTDHKYRIHWAEGLDFTQMKMELSELWAETDQRVTINMNFTDVREAINFTTDYGDGFQVMNESLTTTLSSNLALADNIVYNKTETREVTFVVDYSDPSRGKEILMEGLKCLTGVCDLGFLNLVEIEEDARMWSDPSSWTSGQVPVTGDDVVIEAGWNMYLDVNSGILNSLEINGRLSFLP